MSLHAKIAIPVKLAVRPLWRRAWAKLEARLVPFSQEISQLRREMHDLHRSQEELPAASAAWKQHVPGFLNAVGSVRAFGFELAKQKNELYTANARHESAVAQ